MATYDAVLLAAAGLNRLGSDLSDLVTEELSCSTFTPAPGQGALGIQCRSGDERILAALSHVHDDVTARCVNAERDVLLGLGGGCSMPLGVLIDPLDKGFRLRAALFGGTPNAALRTASIGEDPKSMAADVISAWQPLVGDPLRGLRIATIRPDGERSGLTAALAIAGAEVTALPWTTTAVIRADHEQLESLIDCDALAFTSTRAVRHFTTQCREHGLSPTSHSTFAVGAATATELIQLGYVNVTRASGRGGKALADICQMKGISSGPVDWFAMRPRRHADFEQQASRAGIEVRALPCYQLLTVETPIKPPAALDAFLFTSPSAVKAWMQHAPNKTPSVQSQSARPQPLHLRIGGITSVTTLQDPTPNALIKALQAPGDQGHA